MNISIEPYPEPKLVKTTSPEGQETYVDELNHAQKFANKVAQIDFGKEYEPFENMEAQEETKEEIKEELKEELKEAVKEGGMAADAKKETKSQPEWKKIEAQTQLLEQQRKKFEGSIMRPIGEALHEVGRMIETVQLYQKHNLTAAWWSTVTEKNTLKGPELAIAHHKSKKAIAQSALILQNAIDNLKQNMEKEKGYFGELLALRRDWLLKKSTAKPTKHLTQGKLFVDYSLFSAGSKHVFEVETRPNEAGHITLTFPPDTQFVTGLSFSVPTKGNAVARSVVLDSQWPFTKQLRTAQNGVMFDELLSLLREEAKTAGSGLGIRIRNDHICIENRGKSLRISLKPDADVGSQDEMETHDLSQISSFPIYQRVLKELLQKKHQMQAREEIFTLEFPIQQGKCRLFERQVDDAEELAQFCLHQVFSFIAEHLANLSKPLGLVTREGLIVTITDRPHSKLSFEFEPILEKTNYVHVRRDIYHRKAEKTLEWQAIPGKTTAHKVLHLLNHTPQKMKLPGLEPAREHREHFVAQRSASTNTVDSWSAPHWLQRMNKQIKEMIALPDVAIKKAKTEPIVNVAPEAERHKSPSALANNSPLAPVDLTSPKNGTSPQGSLQGTPPSRNGSTMTNQSPELTAYTRGSSTGTQGGASYVQNSSGTMSQSFSSSYPAHSGSYSGSQGANSQQSYLSQSGNASQGPYNQGNSSQQQQGGYNQGNSSQQQQGPYNQGNSSQGGYNQGSGNSSQQGVYNQGGYNQGGTSSQQGGYNQGNPSQQQGSYNQGGTSSQQGGYSQGNPSQQQGSYNQGNTPSQQGGSYNLGSGSSYNQGNVAQQGSYTQGSAAQSSYNQSSSAPQGSYNQGTNNSSQQQGYHGGNPSAQQNFAAKGYQGYSGTHSQQGHSAQQSSFSHGSNSSSQQQQSSYNQQQTGYNQHQQGSNSHYTNPATRGYAANPTQQQNYNQTSGSYNNLGNSSQQQQSSYSQSSGPPPQQLQQQQQQQQQGSYNQGFGNGSQQGAYNQGSGSSSQQQGYISQSGNSSQQQQQGGYSQGSGNTSQQGYNSGSYNQHGTNSALPTYHQGGYTNSQSSSTGQSYTNNNTSGPTQQNSFPNQGGYSGQPTSQQQQQQTQQGSYNTSYNSTSSNNSTSSQNFQSQPQPQQQGSNQGSHGPSGQWYSQQSGYGSAYGQGGSYQQQQPQNSQQSSFQTGYAQSTSGGSQPSAPSGPFPTSTNHQPTFSSGNAPASQSQQGPPSQVPASGPTISEWSVESLKKKTLKDLKPICIEHGIKTTGKKKDDLIKELIQKKGGQE